MYYWRVAAANVAGHSNFSQIRQFRTAQSTAAEEETVPVKINRLDQNYPNPFNPITTISFSLKDPSQPATVQIFDIRGRLVRTLLSGLPGSHQLSLIWDGKDSVGRDCASGIYHYRLQTSEFVQTRKMILMK